MKEGVFIAITESSAKLKN